MPKIKFTRGKHYKGNTYAAGDVAEVDPLWARVFVSQGAAVPEADAPAPAPAVAVQTPEPPAVTHRDPTPAKRRGR